MNIACNPLFLQGEWLPLGRESQMSYCFTGILYCSVDISSGVDDPSACYDEL